MNLKYSICLICGIGLFLFVDFSTAEHDGSNDVGSHSNATEAEGGGSHGNSTEETGGHSNETYVEGGEGGHGNETEEGGGGHGEEGEGEGHEEEGEGHGLNHQIVILLSAICMIIFILISFYVFYKAYTRYIEYKHEQEAQWNNDKDPLEGAILASAITGAAAPAILGFHELEEKDEKNVGPSTSGSENGGFQREDGGSVKT